MADYNDLEQKLLEIDVKPITIDGSRKAAMRQQMATIIAEYEPVKRPSPKPSHSPFSFFALPAAFAAVFAIVGVLSIVVNSPMNLGDQEGIGRNQPAKVENLLLNPDFSSGTSQWKYERMGRVIEGEMCMSVPDGIENRWDARLKQEDLTYQKGKTYTIAFDGYVTNRSDVSLAFVTEISNQSYTTLHNELFMLTNQPQRYEFTFTSLVDSMQWRKGGGLVIQLGDQGAVEACFDNFTMEEHDGVDETIVADGIQPPRFKNVTAGDFPMGTGRYWNTFDMGEISPVGEMCVNVPEGTRYPWDAHLAHEKLLFVEGRTYQLTFDSYAKQEDVFLRVVAGLSSEPFPLFDEKEIDLTTTKQTHTFEFTAVFNTYNMPNGGNVSMQIGGQGAVDVCFDNVSVVEVE